VSFAAAAAPGARVCAGGSARRERPGREQAKGATASSNYWSASTNVTNPNNAWNANFNNGNVNNNNNKTNDNFVRAVRAGS
jgi:hypothetical protein